MTVVCGYLLLNADRFVTTKYASITFLIGGGAIVSGLLWRFFYNETYHEKAHGNFSKLYPAIKFIQNIVYWIYVILTTMFLIFLLIGGYQYIHNLENEISPAKIRQNQDQLIK